MTVDDLSCSECQHSAGAHEPTGECHIPFCDCPGYRVREDFGTEEYDPSEDVEELDLGSDA